MTQLVVSVSIIVAVGFGCGGTAGEEGGIDGLVSLEVSPADATLTIEGDQPDTERFTVLGTFADGHEEDVTGRVSFDLDDRRLGNFQGSELTTTTELGGYTTVRATSGEIVGTAQLTVILRKQAFDPGADVPADAAARFSGETAIDSARTPSLVYPNDGALVPPNLGKLEFHFRPGDGNTLFEIGYSSPVLDLVVYTRCTRPLNGGCIFEPQPQVWRWMAETARGDDLSVRVRATDDLGSAVASSEPSALNISFDDVEGGIYYWTTPKGGSDADSAIMRWDFGSATQTEPERVVSTSLTDGKCVGCHALSRDGQQMVVATASSFNANVLLFDVQSQAAAVPYDSTPPSAFSSFAPDGGRFVGVFADETQAGFQSYDLNLFDGKSGAFVESIPVGATETTPTTHPDWSPGGDAIVYTRIGEAVSTAGGTIAFGLQASLGMVVRDGLSWSAPIQLTEPVAGQSTYYPSFSPDGDLLIFNRSVCASGANGGDCDMYDDPEAALYVMASQAGASAMALTRAGAPGPEDDASEVQNSFPKWAPFSFQRTGEFGSRLLWLTFSSDRNYGLYEPEDGFTLIWMVGVDPDAVARGEDPSFAAFALPFQDLTTDNHTAQWTERVVGVVP